MRFVLIIHESVCGNPASASKNFLVFAGVPQASRETFWRLRESRKSLGKLLDVCGSPASLSRNFLVFAGTPQASRETFWCLRESRKSLGKLLGICRSSASSIFLFWAFAEVLQAPISPFGVCRNAANVFGRLTRGFIPPSAARRNTRNGRSRAPSAGCVAQVAVAPSGAARRA